MKIYLASDHAGLEMKSQIKNYLIDLGLGYDVLDMGPEFINIEDDYPDFIIPVAEAIAKDKESFGIIFGGSGQGEAMCANRIKGVRAGIFYGQMEPKTTIDANGAESSDSFEIIKLMREHNNVNVLSIGARFVTEDEAKFACELFLNTKFSSDERHVRRLNKF